MEHISRPGRSTLQEQLLRAYCDEAENLLRQSASLQEALTIRDDVCERLREECESTMVFQGAKEYLTGIIRNRWSQEREDPADNHH
jgi:hypothetical protein